MLWPLSLLFRCLALLRKKMQQPQRRPASHTVPVVVIGNIAVGGTGKTPLLITLANYLRQQGYKPGVISRGYGGQASQYPLAVTVDCAVAQCGDEALLIAQKTSCPVVVDPDRESALRFLLANEDVDVVLSDDGLQHYRLHRDIEVVVIDGQRLFGNGFCLPAGPLREPVSRLCQADFLVVNGAPSEHLQALATATVMELRATFLVNLSSGEKRPFAGAPFKMGAKVQAIAALGNPDRFYQLLQQLPYPIEQFSFPDHHVFTEKDFAQRGVNAQQPVVMTEKDAVKCRQFAGANLWYLAVEVQLAKQFRDGITARIDALAK